MVRFKVKKIFACLAVCMLLVSVATATANAASIYDGTISSTYIEYASKIPIPFGDEYVFFRDGQYSYTLLVGDLHYNQGVFTLNGTGRQYVIDTVNQGSYSSANYYTYSTANVSNFTLNTNNRLVFSSLGNFPTLYERGVVYEEVTIFILAVGFVCYLVRSIFSYLLRNRNNVG